jgi:CRP-like cAMP-binding protein
MDDNRLKEQINAVNTLSDEDYALLMTCVQYRELKRGEVVLKEGEACRSFYLVKEGHLRTYYNKDGVAINLNFTFEGAYASDVKSFAGREPSELIIEAGEDTTVWIFEFKQLPGQLKEQPELARFVRRLAIRLLLASEEHSKLFKIYTPTERYHYIEKNNPQLLQRVSLSQIASYLGVTRETISRIRGKNGL